LRRKIDDDGLEVREMASEGAVCTTDVIRKHAAVWPSLERAAVASRKGLKGLARDGRDIQRAAGVGRSDGATLAAALAHTLAP